MKRRSSSKSSRPEPTFFTDRDLGISFPRRLREAGLLVEAHDDHFGPRTLDVDWLTEVGRRGWVVVTRNARIRYTPLEIRALMAASVACFVLVGKMTHPEMAKNFIQAAPRIGRFLEAHRPPFVAKVRRSAEVLMWMPAKKWNG